MVYSVGFVDKGFYKAHIGNTPTVYYNSWSGMLRRCYSKEIECKRPSYKGCSVIESWYNFQKFAKWFEENYVEGWHLDKDILVKGNKIYSPETCCFVPNEVNVLFTSSQSKRGDLPIGVHKSKNGKYKSQIKSNGVVRYLGLFNTPEEAFQAYKVAKEEYIKEVADKWRGQITEKVYNALTNYIVEITD